jgi:uncharacterized protein YaiI (UPF0178 family)
MDIWVDADACPKAIKEILFRLAERRKVCVTLVANKWMRLPESEFIRMAQVPDGPDVADDEIAARCSAGDIVVTADIPLAARAVEKGAWALDPRGKMYDKDNITQTLTMRNFMDRLRGSGVETGGPDSLSQHDRQMFANLLDRLLTKTGKYENG